MTSDLERAYAFAVASRVSRAHAKTTRDDIQLHLGCNTRPYGAGGPRTAGRSPAGSCALPGGRPGATRLRVAAAGGTVQRCANGAAREAPRASAPDPAR